MKNAKILVTIFNAQQLSATNIIERKVEGEEKKMQMKGLMPEDFGKLLKILEIEEGIGK